jgi:hypothetical protein
MSRFYKAFSKEDKMNHKQILIPALLLALFSCLEIKAQSNISIKARIDATQITVGDQAKLFIEAISFNKNNTITWAPIPDSFGKLEVVEKGKIDTVTEGAHTTYRQRLLITGFDSGVFKIPSLYFPVHHPDGNTSIEFTDSFMLSVSTLPVDTTKPFKPIKNIVIVKTTWLDYIWWIVGIGVFLGLVAFVIIYFIKNKRAPIPSFIPKAPAESLEEKALRLLRELEEQELWQKDKIKEYYTKLTDILRAYLEARFKFTALEQTTDEILLQAKRNRDLNRFYDELASILLTADMAKFAKAKPFPQEHMDCMEETRKLIENTRPVITETTTTQKQ